MTRTGGFMNGREKVRELEGTAASDSDIMVAGLKLNYFGKLQYKVRKNRSK